MRSALSRLWACRARPSNARTDVAERCAARCAREQRTWGHPVVVRACREDSPVRSGINAVARSSRVSASAMGDSGRNDARTQLRNTLLRIEGLEDRGVGCRPREEPAAMARSELPHTPRTRHAGRRHPGPSVARAGAIGTAKTMGRIAAFVMGDRTMTRLDDDGDFQATTSASRALFEMTVDLTLLTHDAQKYGVGSKNRGKPQASVGDRRSRRSARQQRRAARHMGVDARLPVSRSRSRSRGGLESLFAVRSEAKYSEDR